MYYEYTPRKTHMTMNKQPFEDVSVIKKCGFSIVVLVFGGGGGYIYFLKLRWTSSV